MPHYSKADLAKMDPFQARTIILANQAQYLRDGFIGDPAPSAVAGASVTPAAPAAPAVAPIVPVANPPAAPPGLSFRERVAAAEKASPGSGRVLLLQDPRAYLDDTAGPAPIVPEAARVELGAAEQARADLLKELGVESVEAARTKLGIPAPVAPVAPAAPPAPQVAK